ncbi:MAG: VIT1/CCC1 transporter family protein [Anaerolineae bacterium]
MAEARAAVTITPEIKQMLVGFQRNEITEHHIYHRLAASMKTPENRDILEQIAADELRHYQIWRSYSGEDVEPDQRKIWFYTLVSRVFGLTFGLKLMESGEGATHEDYTPLIGIIPDAEQLAKEEQMHESRLIDLLDEDLLRYVGSIVLGLNDALVELTGALAGLTLALQNTRLIAMTGAITGIAAALSMATSEYLSVREEQEETERAPGRAALYTGLAYIVTVLVLIAPYLVFSNYFVCLVAALIIAVGIIAIFNYYVSVARELPFRRRFLEMAALSLSVASFSFLVGYVMRALFGIEV